MTTDPTENTTPAPASAPPEAEESISESIHVSEPSSDSTAATDVVPESPDGEPVPAAENPEPVSASPKPEPAPSSRAQSSVPEPRWQPSPHPGPYTPPVIQPHRNYAGYAVAILALGVLAVGGWRGWVAWQAYDARLQEQMGALETQLESMKQQTDVLSGDLRSQSQRLTDAASANRTLREELFGLDQRSKLLEESVAKLTENSRQSIRAAHLGEVELLLTFGAERLNVAGDAEGARRVYALASDLLNDVDGDVSILNLRQTLAQERAALDKLGPGPQASLAERLNRLAASLDGLPTESPASENRPVWQRWLAPLLDIRPSQQRVLLNPVERATAEAALQIEFGLARAALERGDSSGFQQALARSDAWLTRLWPDSPALQESRHEIEALRQMPLRPDLPALGTTLQQLRTMRDGRNTP
ncbi:MAG: hypothetical protein LBV45_04050 [Xanthomonadaceae bacterium]|jgi:uroporphyrin-3 C-methyltransferase|nr:hypothetical protein [Xanthomonadaceae bacterium]